MKTLKKVHQNVGQNVTKPNSPQKHDANVKKDATLYFQIGLILALLITYALFELPFKTREISVEEALPTIEDDLYAFNDFVIEEDQAKKEVQKKEQKKLLIDDPKVVPDDFDFNDLLDDIITEPLPKEGATIKDITVIDEPDIHNIITVEQVPIFPGCEDLKTNTERRQCFSDKINALVSKKFNVDKISDKGISGRYRIDVQFTIDVTGNIVDKKIRSPFKVLDVEAQRVIDKIPNMVPARQGSKNVSVVYSLPIIIQIQE